MSELKPKLAEALVAAQSEIGNVSRNKQGQAGNHKYMYADLASVLEAVREPLAKHGLSVQQVCHPAEGFAHVSTRVTHKSGEWFEDDGCLVPYEGGAQQYGSALTYARRYSLCAVLGIAQEDDDASSAASNPITVAGDASTPASSVKPVAADSGTFTFTFGKHKGKSLADVPSDYLEWLIKQPVKDEKYAAKDARDKQAYRGELDRRKTALDGFQAVFDTEEILA